MSLQISGRDQEGIQCLDLKGSLVFGADDSKFRDELDGMISAGKTSIILNLKDLRRLDTTGLGTILYYASVRFPMNHGKLVVCDLGALHMEMLKITTPAAVLQVFPTEADAVDSFFPERQANRHYLLAFAQSEALDASKFRDSDGGTTKKL